MSESVLLGALSGSVAFGAWFGTSKLPKFLRQRRFRAAFKEAMESGAHIGCQAPEEPEDCPQGHVRSIEVDFPEYVQMTGEDERDILNIVNRMCNRYELQNPDRVMWPCGIGGRPLNIWSDEDFRTDMSVFLIDVSERENYDHEEPADQ